MTEWREDYASAARTLLGMADDEPDTPKQTTPTGVEITCPDPGRVPARSDEGRAQA